MRILCSVVFVLHLVVAGLFGQNPPPAKASTVAPPPPGVTLSEPSYPFPPEDKAKIRDFQYESDQLEIQNQKLQVQIEQNKARQAQLLDQEKTVAFNFATARKINLDLYELDPVQVRFIKKQPPKK